MKQSVPLNIPVHISQYVSEGGYEDVAEVGSTKAEARKREGGSYLSADLSAVLTAIAQSAAADHIVSLWYRHLLSPFLSAGSPAPMRNLILTSGIFWHQTWFLYTTTVFLLYAHQIVQTGR